MPDLVDPSVVQGVLVAVVTGAAGWLGSRKINASKAKQTDGEGSRADFELLRQSWRDEHAKAKEQYTALSLKCAADAERSELAIADLRGRVEGMEKEITTTKARFWQLLGYTRKVMDQVRRIDADHPLPPVPEDLREWLGHG